jgi:serine/threonine protein phosphatase PrpC
MKYTTHTHTGQRKGHNEDSVATVVMEDTHLNTDREVGLFVLSDGAGGLERGDVASYIATTEVVRKLADDLYPLLVNDSEDVGIELPGSFATQASTEESEAPEPPLAPDAPNPSELREKLVDAINSAHQRMIKYAKENEMSRGPHATIVAGIYVDDVLHYAWVGDSRLYVLNVEKEQLDLLTKDHARVQDLEDQNKVNDVEAKIHPDGNQITRALGGGASNSTDDTVNVDTNSVEIYESDVVFFTSDGIIDAYPHIRRLWGMYQSADPGDKDDIANEIWDTVVSEDDIRKIILDCISGSEVTEEELATAGRTLLTVGNRHGGKDNMSFIFLSGDTAKPAPVELPERGPETGVDIGDPEPEDHDDYEAGETKPNQPEDEDEQTTTDESEPADEEPANKREQDETVEEDAETGDGESADEDVVDESDSDVLVLCRDETDEAHRIEDGDTVGSGADADHTVEGEQIASKHVRFELTDDGLWKVHDLKTESTWILEPNLSGWRVQLGTETQMFEGEVSAGEWICLGTTKDKFEIVKA